MTLRLALCFHFHQPLGEPAENASRLCYRGLLETLLRHPRLKFNLAPSGTLLDALCWFDPAALDSVRAGLAGGGFRLLGTTYAGNFLLACEDEDNVRQIGLHRKTMKKYFQAEPAAFWSPGHTWSVRHADLLRRAGYDCLPLDGRMLADAGAAGPSPHRLPGGDAPLTALWDDAGLRSRLLYAAWFHRPDAFLDPLAAMQLRADTAGLFPVVSADADALAMWGYNAGLDPRADIAGLEEILTALESRPDMETAFLEEAPPPAGTLEGLTEGWGECLDRALRDPDAPGHEEGYSNWRDFIARAPRIQHFRRIHTGARSRLHAAEFALAAAASADPARETVSGRKIFELAEKTFCANQSGFGGVGVGGRGDPAWEGMGASTAVAKGAELAALPAPASAAWTSIDDVTADGEDEILLRAGDDLAVLSPFGGRLLYWMDLGRGSLHIGNPLGVPTGLLLLEARSPESAPLPDDWIPGGEPLAAEEQEPYPGRRLAYLDSGRLPSETGPLPVVPRPRRTGLMPSLPARNRALNDYVSLDDGPEEPAEPRLDFRLADSAVTFLRFFGYRLRMTKRISLTAGGVRAVYRFWNVNHRPMTVRLRVVSELCPDYPSLWEEPENGLRPIFIGPRRHAAILNRHTRRALVCHASRRPSEPVKFQKGLFAQQVGLNFTFTLEPSGAETLMIRFDFHADAAPEKKGPV